MKTESRFSLEVDGKKVLTITGGKDNGNSYLSYGMPGSRHSIRVEWQMTRAVKPDKRDLRQGLPVKVSFDGKPPVSFHYRDKRLYARGSGKAWSPKGLTAWTNLFQRLANAKPQVSRDSDFDVNQSSGTVDQSSGTIHVDIPSWSPTPPAPPCVTVMLPTWPIQVPACVPPGTDVPEEQPDEDESGD